MVISATSKGYFLLQSMSGWVSEFTYATDLIVGKTVFQTQHRILLGHRIKQKCTDLDLKICRPNTWTFKKYCFLDVAARTQMIFREQFFSCHLLIQLQ